MGGPFRFDLRFAPAGGAWPRNPVVLTGQTLRVYARAIAVDGSVVDPATIIGAVWRIYEPGGVPIEFAAVPEAGANEWSVASENATVGTWRAEIEFVGPPRSVGQISWRVQQRGNNNPVRPLVVDEDGRPISAPDAVLLSARRLGELLAVSALEPGDRVFLGRGGAARALSGQAVLDAATGQALAVVGSRIARAGDRMDGPLELSADPSSDLHAVRRGWANARLDERASRVNPVLDGLFRHTGAVSKRSNHGREWRWAQGNPNGDEGWKVAATINIPAGTFRAVQMEVTCRVGTSNYGATARRSRRTYTVSAHRSAAVDGDADTGEVNGPDANHVRLMRTALGVYELHIRAGSGGFADYRWIVSAQGSMVDTDAAITWASLPPPNAGSGGTIFTAGVSASNADIVEALTVAPGGALNMGTNAALTLGGDPAADLQPATRRYLDRGFRPFATRVQAAATNIPPQVESIYCAASASAGDGGEMRWRAVGTTQPSHGFTFQSFDGRWWVPNQPNVNIRALGATAGGPDIINILNAARDFCSIAPTRFFIEIPAGGYNFTGPWNLQTSLLYVRGLDESAALINISASTSAIVVSAPNPATTQIASVTIENLQVDCAVNDNTGIALDVVRGTNIRLRGLTLAGHLVGLQNNGSFIRGSRITTSSGARFTQKARPGSAAVVMRNFAPGDGTEAIGFFDACRFIGGASPDGSRDAMTQTGIRVDGCDTVIMTNCQTGGFQTAIDFNPGADAKAASFLYHGFIEGSIVTATSGPYSGVNIPDALYGLRIRGTVGVSQLVINARFSGFRENAIEIDNPNAAAIDISGVIDWVWKDAVRLASFRQVKLSLAISQFAWLDRMAGYAAIRVEAAAATSNLTLAGCSVDGAPKAGTFQSRFAPAVTAGVGLALAGYTGSISGTLLATSVVTQRTLSGAPALVQIGPPLGPFANHAAAAAAGVAPGEVYRETGGNVVWRAA